MNLEQPQSSKDGWSARGMAVDSKVVSSGYTELDALLPEGGWPRASVTEILTSQRSVGALRLLMPVLAALSQNDRWLCLVAPPHKPYAASLRAAGIDLSRILLIHPRSRQDGLRAVEQSLRSGQCGAVLAWPTLINRGIINRLQSAAEAGDTHAFLFCSQQYCEPELSAILPIRLDTHTDGNLSVTLLNRSKDYPSSPLYLDTSLLNVMRGSCLKQVSQSGSLHKH